MRKFRNKLRIAATNMKRPNLMLVGLAWMALFALPLTAQDNKPAPAPGGQPATPAPAPAGAVQTAPKEARNIWFQFDGMPYMDAIERFAQMAGKPLLSGTNVDGTISFTDPRPYTYAEALDTLNLILSMKGVTLMESDRYLRLVPFQDLQQLPIPILHGLSQAGEARPNEIVTVVLELKYLDAAEVAKAVTPLLTRAGAIAPLSRGRGLIVTDRLANIKRVQNLLTEIDAESSTQRQMKTYTLLHASGAVVADLINRTFGVNTAPKRTVFNDQTKHFDELTPDPNDYVTAVFDDASRTLVLFGPGDRVALAEELIKRFEDKEGGHAGEVRIYYPQLTRAEELARMVREAVPGVAQPGETAAAAATKARLIVDAPLNRLIVAAPIAGQLDAIEALVQKIDKSTPSNASGIPSQDVQVTKIFQPRATDPLTAAQVVTNAVTKPGPGGGIVSRVIVTVDAATRAVVVTGSPGDVQQVADIMSQLEAASATRVEQETRFLDVGGRAEVKRLAPLVEQLFRNQVGEGNPPGSARAKIIPDEESGRLIVTGSPEHLAAIESIVAQLKTRPALSRARQLQIISLKNISVDAVLNNVTNLVAEKMSDRRFQDQPPPLLLPDPAGNRLLVTATDDQFQAIEGIVRVLDVAPAAPHRELEVIPLQWKSATDVIPLVNQLLGNIQRDPISAKFPPNLTADPSGKKIIVLALKEDLPRIQSLVEQIDGSASTGAVRQFRAVELFRRKSADLVPLVQKLYQEQLKGRPDPDGGPATLLAENKPNRLMVSGSTAEISRVEAIVRQLDPVDKTLGPEETRVVRLKTAVAAELSGLVEKSLNTQEEKVTLLVDPRSNSLVLTGSKSAVETASRIIEELDTNPYLQPRELRIIELKSAEAATVAPMVTDLFTQMMHDQRGPNYVSPTKIVPDAAANRLIVTGLHDELAQVAALVEKLDQKPEQAGGARVFQLQTAEARLLAPIVSNAMVTFDAQNRAVSRVTVSADEDSNSLIVAGPRAEIQDASVIIEKLDGQARSRKRAFKVVEVKSDDPAQLATLALQIFSNQNQGAGPANQVSITPDVKGRRLVVLAPEFLFPQVEEVITALDHLPTEGPRELHLVELKQGRAQDLLPTVTKIYGEQSQGKNVRPATLFAGDSDNRLAVVGSAEQAADIEKIVATLEGQKESPARLTKVFDLGKLAEAQRLLPLLQQLYQDHVKNRPQAGPADAQILSDGKTGKLIVSAREDQLPDIEAIVTRLQSGTNELAGRETRSFQVGQPADAERLQTLVQKLYQDQWKDHGEDDPPDAQILADPKTGRLYVSGRPEHLRKIEAIIKELGAHEFKVAPIETRVYELNSASATELATTVQRIYEEQLKTRPAATTVETLILPDASANRLIVSGAREELETLEVIIKKLDQVSAQTAGTRVFKLKTSDAEQIASLLSTALVQIQPGGRSVPRVSVGADSKSNTLIVSGEPKDLQSAAVIIEQLDNLAQKEPRHMEILPLQSGLASDLATKVKELYLNQMKGHPEAGASDALIMGDDSSNRLIITAVQAQIDIIREIVNRLEQSPNGAARQLRVLNLKNNSAAAVVTIASQVFARQIASPDPAQKLVLTAGPDDHTVVLDANGTLFPQVEKLIQTLDEPGWEANEVLRTVHLKQAQAQALAEAVSQTMQTRPGAPGRKLTVTPVLGANSLLLRGSTQDVDEALKVIQDLDQESEGNDIEVHIYKLENGEVKEVSAILRQLLQGWEANLPRRQRSAGRATATITTDDRSNSLIVAGTAAHFRFLEKTIPLLDKAPERPEREIQFIWLKNAHADEVVPKVEALFLDRSRSDRPVIDSDVFSNSLTVIGKPNDIRDIQSVVQRLDESALDMSIQVRLLPVDKIPVEQMAAMLRNIYSQMYHGQIRVVEKLPPPKPGDATNVPPPSAVEPKPGQPSQPSQPAPANPSAPLPPGLKSMDGQPVGPARASATEVVIAVDKDANALMLSGPAHELDRIADLVNQLSVETLSGDAEFRQFSLREADPVVVARTLTELFKREPVQIQENGKPKTVTPAPKLTIVAEPRTRSVIIRGRPSDFPLVENIIKQLDSEGPGSQVAFRLFVLTNAVPEKVLPLVNQMVTQLQLVKPGEPLSVTIDSRSRGLLVVARDTILDQMERVIHALDGPSAFAEAQVKLVSLKRSSAVQLAGILQAMLRPGAQGELTPEARELQEQVRRLNVQNDQGQSVTLDLTKPIKIMADPLQAGQNGGNRLILTSTPDNLRALAAVVEMMDQVPLTDGVEVRLLRLEHADATTVSQTLTTVFQQGQQLAAGPGGKAQPEGETGQALTFPLNLAVDKRSNTLLLSGRPESLRLAERIVKDLDGELERFLTEVKLFRLKHASAIKLAPMLQTVFAETASATGTEGRDTQVTRLQTVPENQAAKTTTQPKSHPALIVQADETSNILIVAARKDVLPLIEDVIDKMDIPSASGLESLRLYPLEHAEAANVEKVITDLFDRSKVPQLRAEDRPNVTVDTRSNTLIISGNDKALAIVDNLITQLDTATVREKTTFRVFPLKLATASKLQDTLEKLFAKRTPRVTGRAPEPITVLADAWANALIVSASPEDMTMVASLVERLDGAQADLESEIEILPLSKGDARRVAETIQGLYRDTPGTAASPVAVNVDERLNALVVSAGEVDRKRIAELVKKLDTDAVSRVSEIRILPLRYARAEALSTLLNTALNTKPEPLTQQSPNTQSLLQFVTRTENGKDLITSALRERVSITPDPRMNSLIVSAPLDYMELLEQIVTRLDNESPQPAKIRVFTLKNADARQMMEMLTTLFRRQSVTGQSSSQRTVQYTLVKPEEDPEKAPVEPVPDEAASATVGTAEENALTVTVDPRTNSLLIGGSDHYIALASEIITALDASEGMERKTQVYRLKNAQAVEVQTALRSFLDQDRQRITQVLGQDAMGTAQRLLEREVAIVAEPVSNTLLLSANPRYFEQVNALIKELDQPQPQVLIQALIAEVTLDSTTDLGMEWTYNGKSGNATYATGTDFGVADALSSFGGFSSAITGSDYTFLLRALQSDGRLHVLSRPQILTADNMPATINVGQRVPLITNSRVTDNGNTINSFEYQTVGVILTVTPRISPDGFVKMDVGTTNSALSSSSVDVTKGVTAPIINERLATTTVSVQSGQSIIIGGLISTSEDSRNKRIPWLGNIPLLGALFRSTSDFRNRQELLIFLTPQVLVKSEEFVPTELTPEEMTRKQLKESTLKDKFKGDIEKGEMMELMPFETKPNPFPGNQNFQPLDQPKKKGP
jgi:type II secretion system protein D